MATVAPEKDAQTRDRDAVRRALSGDQRGFQELLDAYRDRIYSFLLRLAGHADAEDLAQEVFLKAFTKLESWDAERPLISWLFRIAHNAAVDHLRARAPRAESLDVDEAYEAPEPDPTPEEALRAKTDSELIETLMASLPPIYREAVLLRHREDLDIPQLAHVLGLPEGTVKVRLFRGRDMLKRKLLACGWTERN